MGNVGLAQLDLNLLYTLHEVARTGSVTAAARALGLTQPAISTRLRLLEGQLGTTLFERAGASLRFTPTERPSWTKFACSSRRSGPSSVEREASAMRVGTASTGARRERTCQNDA